MSHFQRTTMHRSDHQTSYHPSAPGAAARDSHLSRAGQASPPPSRFSSSAKQQDFRAANANNFREADWGKPRSDDNYHHGRDPYHPPVNRYYSDARQANPSQSSPRGPSSAEQRGPQTASDQEANFNQSSYSCQGILERWRNGRVLYLNATKVAMSSITKASEAGDYDAVPKIIQQLNSAKFPIDVQAYSAAITAYANALKGKQDSETRSGFVAAGFAAYDAVGESADFITHSAFITFCANALQDEPDLKIRSKLIQAGRDAYAAVGDLANLTTHNAFITFCANALKGEQDPNIKSKLIQLGRTAYTKVGKSANLTTHNALITLCANALKDEQNPQTRLELIQLGRDAYTAVGESANIITRSAFITFCANALKGEQDQNIRSKLIQAGLAAYQAVGASANLVTYTAVISLHFSAHDLASADSILLKMEQSKLISFREFGRKEENGIKYDFHFGAEKQLTVEGSLSAEIAIVILRRYAEKMLTSLQAGEQVSLITGYNDGTAVRDGLMAYIEANKSTLGFRAEVDFVNAGRVRLALVTETSGRKRKAESEQPELLASSDSSAKRIQQEEYAAAREQARYTEEWYRKLLDPYNDYAIVQAVSNNGEPGARSRRH